MSASPNADYADACGTWRSNRLRCPRCDSDQCECIIDGKTHTHVCGDCGLTDTWAVFPNGSSELS